MVGNSVVFRLLSSGRFLAACRNRCKFASRNARSLPERSSRMKVNPPEAPTPGMAGGVMENAMPSGMVPSRRLRNRTSSVAWSSLDLRSSQGFSLMKKAPE